MPRAKETTTTASIELSLSSSSETEAVGKAIGGALLGGEAITFFGDLGAGKTTMIRGIAEGLGISPASVSSPTFILVHEYHGRLPLIHIDFYRLKNHIEAESIGLEDYLTEPAVAAIEWADRFPELLPDDRLEVYLSHRSLSRRTACLTAQGPRSLYLLNRIGLTTRPNGRRSTKPGRRRVSDRRKARQS